jgi:tRNA dimethylallyltransferase
MVDIPAIGYWQATDFAFLSWSLYHYTYPCRLIQQIMNRDMILILGVTGSGKGRLAFDLADDAGAEIISIDSMKVYRRMDIGTAKPPEEARKRVKYHLLDVVEPSDSFSVKAFLDAALDAIEQIKSRNKPIVAVGGTALYMKALLYGLFEGPGADEQIRAALWARAETEGLEPLYHHLKQVDPEAAARIHPNDAKRIIRALEVYELTGRPISSFQQQWNAPETMHEAQCLAGTPVVPADDGRWTMDEPRVTGHVRDWTIIGLRREKAEASRRINARVKRMIAAGLVDEVKSLLAEKKPLSPQARSAIGYAEIIEYLNGRRNLQDAIELIKKNTRRLAKSQRTWFRTFKNVNWLDVEPDDARERLFKRAQRLLNNVE